MRTYDSYKHSGIKWIGEIPEHWIAKRLKYFAKICNGKDYREIQVEEGGFPVYGTGGVFNYASEYLYDKPSVLLARKGTVDKPLFVNEPFWTSDTIYYTEIQTGVYPKFVYYLSKIILFDFYTYGSAVPSMTKEHYDNMIFGYPPLKEQTAIANYLDTKTTEIDQTISDKEALINLYEEEKKALINEAVTKGLNPKVKFKPSGIDWLGDIPEHWEVKKLKYLVDKIGSGVTPRGGSDVYELEGIPLLRSQNIYNDGLRLDDVAFITEETHNLMKGSKVKINDILLNITGASLGRCYYFDGSLQEANVNQHVCIIRVNEKVNSYFIRFCIISDFIEKQIENSYTGSGREGLSNENLNNFYFGIPPLKEQNAIVQYIETETTKINKIVSLTKKEIELLKEYRQALIFEAVTGKIKVND